MKNSIWIAALATLTLTTPALAGTIEGAAIATATATDQSDDSAVFAGVDLGYRLGERLGLYLRLSAGLGDARDRSLQALGAGVRFAYPMGSWRPTARLGFVHQHEVARDELAAAELLGYGENIDHRTGASVGLGLNREISDYRFGTIYGGVELGADVFADADPGPRSYIGGSLVLGLTFDR